MWGAAVVALATAAPGGAFAQSNDVERVEALYVEGAAHFNAGRFQDAIQKFTEAYAVYPQPNLLYNIARSYEAMGALDDAASYYARFLQRKGTDPRIRAKAERKLRVIQRARQKTQPDPSPSLPPPAPPPRASSPDSMPPSAAPTPLSVPAYRPPPSSSLTVWKWTTGAVAAAGLVVGGVLYGVGQNDHDKVSNAKDAAAGGSASLTQVEADNLIDEGSQKKTAGIAVISAGAAVGVLSAVLFFLDTDEDAVRLGAAPVRDGVAFAVGGHF